MKHSIVYQFDIREFFFRHQQTNHKIKTLIDLPFEFFKELKALGVDYIWPLGIYEPSKESQKIAREMKELHRRYDESLPGWTIEDVIGSPYAIKSYSVSKSFGADRFYTKFKELLLKKFDLKIILDFVHNHVAIDNPIVKKHPEYFIHCVENNELKYSPDFYELKAGEKTYFIAHGRDPYFPSWKDTLQLDYRSKSVQKFMINELLKLSKKCDGVRCDMAMLGLSNIFHNNWKNYQLPNDAVPSGKEFWREAIDKVKKKNPDFIFIGEVYWDCEKDLLDLGFDYVYDKKFYDLMVKQNILLINEYIKRAFTYGRNRFLFLENHDEPRSSLVFNLDYIKVLATLVYTLPSMKLIHAGQIEGKKYPHAIQLRRIYSEPLSGELKNFYLKLLFAIKSSTITNGYFKYLNPLPAWEGSISHNNFTIFLYENEKMNIDLVVLNLSPYQSQCKVKVESYNIVDKKFLIKDRLSDEEYLRDGNEMYYDGLYFDLKPYQSQIFQFIKTE